MRMTAMISFNSILFLLSQRYFFRKRLTPNAAKLLPNLIQHFSEFALNTRKNRDIVHYDSTQFFADLIFRQIADKLKLGQSVDPELYDSATVFFSDVVSFTTIAAKGTPLQVWVSPSTISFKCPCSREEIYPFSQGLKISFFLTSEMHKVFIDYCQP